MGTSNNRTSTSAIEAYRKHESSKTTYYNGYGGLIDNEFLKTLHEIWNKEQTFHPAQAYEQTHRIVLDLI